MIILFRMTRDITIYDTRRLCHALSLLQYHEGDRTEVDSEHIQCGTELGQIGWKPICWGLIELSRNWTEPQKKVLQPPEIGELLSIPQAFPGSPCSPRTAIGIVHRIQRIVLNQPLTTAKSSAIQIHSIQILMQVHYMLCMTLILINISCW